MDMIDTDESASQITDKIKDLFTPNLVKKLMHLDLM